MLAKQLVKQLMQDTKIASVLMSSSLGLYEPNEISEPNAKPSE